MGARKLRDGSPAQAPDQSTAKPDDLLVMASKYTGTGVIYCSIILILTLKQTTVLLAQRGAWSAFTIQTSLTSFAFLSKSSKGEHLS